jgi:two-component system, cell cycle sensor histidine kinase and response regulator CckA
MPSGVWNILYYCGGDAQDPLPDALRGLGHSVTVARQAAHPVAGEKVCILSLPRELDRACSLIREIRRIQIPSLPLLACGHWADARSIVVILQAGADDYLSLPCPPTRVVERLACVIEFHRRLLPENQRRKAEDDLARTQRLETLAFLAGGIAHDYNNMLTVVRGNAELALLSDSLPSSVRSNLNKIEEASARAAELTRQMLSYSSPGPASGQKQPVNLVHLIRELSELLRVSVPPGCRVDYSLAKDLPSVRGDQRSLRQLILGLVVEWAREMPPNSTIRVSAAAADRPSPQTVCLEFTGPGKPSLQGLEAVSLLAQEQRAQIEAESNPDGTASVRIAFLEEPRPQGAAALDVRQRLEADGVILFIDDDEAVRIATEHLLSLAGFTVRLAETCDEGVVRFLDAPGEFDAVILDLRLPGETPRRAIETMRKARPDVRIVIWSGIPEADARQSLAGIPDLFFVEKPMPVTELVALLVATLRH